MESVEAGQQQACVKARKSPGQERSRSDALRDRNGYEAGTDSRSHDGNKSEARVVEHSRVQGSVCRKDPWRRFTTHVRLMAYAESGKKAAAPRVAMALKSAVPR